MARRAFNVGVFGAGYAGLVTAAGFAELGHAVVVRDVIREKVETLRRGESPIYEPGLGDLMQRNAERLTFTLDPRDLARCEFLFVCVDTPPTYSGDADLSRVWTVLDDLPDLEQRAILVMKSTVPVGTGETVRAALDARGLEDVGYVSNPEFLAEGTAVRDFLEPDRIVVGAFEEADGEAVEALHGGIDAPVVRTDVPSAEMIKLAANAFLGTRISFINEIANVCEVTGADVDQVKLGMGLDRRIGTRYLNPGIGFGGSCLAGEETVLVRSANETRLTSLEALFGELSLDARDGSGVVRPEALEILSWTPGSPSPEFLPVSAATRRWYSGEIVELRTKMGRRIRCTPDHPLVVANGEGADITVKEAGTLCPDDWLPVAPARPVAWREPRRETLNILAGLEFADASPRDVIVRPVRTEIAAVEPRRLRSALDTLSDRSASAMRPYDILRSGALRLDEMRAAGISEAGAMFGTAKNGTYVPRELEIDDRFWRVVGLYIAEGHCSVDGRRRRIAWSFNRDTELDLAEEILRFWRLLGIKTTLRFSETAVNVSISSRLLAGWWLGTLGLGVNSYVQRLPDKIWQAPDGHKRALLGGLWRGDGSWSLISGGPSVVLEYGTASRELADGLLRLLGDLGIVARLKIGRTAKSTCDTYWLVVSGADQVEQLLELVKESERGVIGLSIAHQTKRIAPSGYRRRQSGTWVRVHEAVRRPFEGFVYSLEVPGNEMFVTTGGLVVHNCFPKDISFLKLLAGNSGYHFQLLNAVIEVNELQKRRVVGKLQKHLGALRGKTIAVLGLAFKAGTDDLREAPSIVLASRLLAEGADVRAWDPVADARSVLRGVTFAGTVLDAVRGADAAVIVTEWDELRSLASSEVRAAMRTPLIVDGRNLLAPEAVRAAGFAYEGVGRPASPLEALPETPERESELQA